MAPATLFKHCIKCHKDVTGAKRMKDSKGQYWCHDCGSKEEASRTSSLFQKCPGCGNPTHATKFVRVRETYLCESCADGTSTSKGGGLSSQRNDKIKVILATLCLVAGVALIVKNYV